MSVCQGNYYVESALLIPCNPVQLVTCYLETREASPSYSPIAMAWQSEDLKKV